MIKPIGVLQAVIRIRLEHIKHLVNAEELLKLSQEQASLAGKSCGLGLGKNTASTTPICLLTHPATAAFPTFQRQPPPGAAYLGQILSYPAAACRAVLPPGGAPYFFL